MDHGTTGVSFTILGDGAEHFKIGREDLSAGRVSALEELKERVSLDDIRLMAITLCRTPGLCSTRALMMCVSGSILLTPLFLWPVV